MLEELRGGMLRDGSVGRDACHLTSLLGPHGRRNESPAAKSSSGLHRCAVTPPPHYNKQTDKNNKELKESVLSVMQ